MQDELSLVPRQARVNLPTLRELVAVLFRQRRLFLITFLGIAGAGIFYGLTTPTYQAHMKVLVRRGRVDPVVTPAPTASSQFDRGEVSEEELNSEVELLRDDDLLRKVVQQTGMATGDPGHWWRLGRPRDDVAVARAAQRVARHLQIEPVRRTTVIRVSYESSDPEAAARVLRSLADAYVEKHLEVHRPAGESSFFEQQMAQYRTRLTEADARLLAFTQDGGVVVASTERDGLLVRLGDADAADRQVQVTMAECLERIRALESKLASFPERRTAQVRTLDNMQLLEKLKSQLLELELKRTALLTKFAANYPLVQEAEQQIADTRATIAAEEAKPARDEITEPDPNREWAKSELAKAQVEWQALQARKTASHGLVNQYRQMAQQLERDTVEQQDLMRDVKAAEDNYLLYTRKREEARLKDALDERGILNVAIAEEPAVPAIPARSSLMFGLAAFALAGVTSTGVAFFADAMDPSFRTPDEVVTYLKAPVLASLPKESGGRW